MKSISFIKHPELFQGEKYLNQSSHYFEGWYFKCNNGVFDIAFIPGISIEENKKMAFIQVITQNNSYFIPFDIQDFSFTHSPFSIKIGDNFFSMHKIKINIDDNNSGLCIHGELTLRHTKPIDTSLFCPNIMGPFSYFSSMECNHAILAMKNTVSGSLTLNDKQISFDSGVGYIEKDWGTSFPKSYLWCQANQFENRDINFMISIAHIPFYSFEFQGLICVLQTEHQELKFTTYHGSKIIKYNVTPTKINIELKKGKYTLLVNSSDSKGLSLAAPVKGKMEKEVFESINANLFLTLKKEDQVLFSGSSKHAGLEIVI